MGSIIFDPTVLADNLTEVIGYKAGLALSIAQMCDLLSDTDYPDLIRESEKQHIRLRSEDYDSLFFKLLHRTGHTEEEFDGDVLGTYLWHRYKDNQAVVAGVKDLYIEMWSQLIDGAKAAGRSSIDPTPFLKAVHDRYGRLGVTIALEQMRAIERGVRLSPHSMQRYVEWKAVKELDALFNGSNAVPEHGLFIDQRFIDFLSINKDKLGAIHWRKFEELTAEFFAQAGFRIELGPGQNDDGVDIRIWKDGSAPTGKPTCIVQCKREKAKVGKLVVKGLYADVVHEGAEYGLVVTSSELSVGARKTITVRGYPIGEANSTTLSQWLDILRTPGTGIVRV